MASTDEVEMPLDIKTDIEIAFNLIFQKFYIFFFTHRSDKSCYQNIEGLVEKIDLLENILKGNLLSMLKGLDIHLDQELIVKITQISEPYILYNKGIGMTAFNADFNCNLTIPNNVGVGKNASIGYGIVHLEKKDNN